MDGGRSARGLHGFAQKRRLLAETFDQVDLCAFGVRQCAGNDDPRKSGAGPQIGYIFPVAGMQGFLGAKSYFEFDAKNRPDGWNAWVTFALSPAAPEAPCRDRLRACARITSP